MKTNIPMQVSGRIKFIDGPSRFPVINIVQHINGEIRTIGNFYPNISETTNEVDGGTLDLNISSIVWLSEHMPDDGLESPKKCALYGFAQLLGVSCEDAIVIANIIGFGLFGVLLIIGFIIIKRK